MKKRQHEKGGMSKLKGSLLNHSKKKTKKISSVARIKKGRDKKGSNILRRINQKKGSEIEKQYKKRIRILNFSRRLLAMCFLPMIFTCVLVTAISTNTLKSAMENEIKNSMRIAAASIDETYTNLYKGDYSQDLGGSIKKGDTTISGNYELVDAMSKKTGFDVTMMFGNMRLLTTVKSDTGARANGTSTDNEVYEKIAKGQKVFLKDFVVGENTCYAYYEPLVNSDGSVFGAVEIAKEGSSVQKTIEKQVRQLVVFSILIVAVVCVIVIVTSHSMVEKILRIKRFLDRITEGRLDHQVHAKTLKTNDELGDVYRSCVKLQETFREMVSAIKNSGDNLKVSADDLSGMAQSNTAKAMDVKDAVDKISMGARSQAENTEDAQGSVDTINNQIEQIIGEVDIMAQKAEEMSQKEKESEQIIHELSASSDDTKASVSKATEQINLMHDAVKDIKNAVELIQSIADETDLLSINANIEAARAGEAGRGFAVVADQINKLAIQSNASSMDIQNMLDKVADITEKTVAVMDEVRENMDVQQQKLTLTRQTYQAVSDGVEQSRCNMGNIKEKIVILNSSGTAISTAIGDLASVADENVNAASDTIHIVNDMNDTMQQVQASSEELLSMAGDLQKTMGSFQI